MKPEDFHALSNDGRTQVWKRLSIEEQREIEDFYKTHAKQNAAANSLPPNVSQRTSSFEPPVTVIFCAIFAYISAIGGGCLLLIGIAFGFLTLPLTCIAIGGIMSAVLWRALGLIVTYLAKIEFRMSKGISTE